MGSEAGAVGDVMGVRLSLKVSSVDPNKIYGPGIEVVVSHDPNIAEIVGGPVLSGEFMEMVGMGYSRFEQIDIDGCLPEGVLGHGFYLIT